MSIALGDLVAALQFFALSIHDTKRLSDVIHAILIRRRVVATRRLVAHRIGVVPSGIEVARREAGTRFGVPLDGVLQLDAAGMRRRLGSHVHLTLDPRRVQQIEVGEPPTFTTECRGMRRMVRRGLGCRGRASRPSLRNDGRRYGT